MDFDAVLGLDSGSAEPKKKKRERPTARKTAAATRKGAKPKGLLRSLRSTKKKSSENLLAAEAAEGSARQRSAKAPGRSERQQLTGSATARRAVEGYERRLSTVKKMTKKSTHNAGGDPVLISSASVFSAMRKDVAVLSANWPSAALKRALVANEELLRCRQTSECPVSDTIAELVAYAINTPDSLTRWNDDAEANMNPFRAATATKGSTGQVQTSKALDKDAVLLRRQMQTTLCTFVSGPKAKYFWKSVETKLKREDVRAIRIMYQRAAFNFALDQLRCLSHSAIELGLAVGKKSCDVAHALLRTDSAKLEKLCGDSKFVRSLSLLWQDDAIREAFRQMKAPPEKFQICTFMLDGLERILGPKYTPQSADFQYLQYLSREKLRTIRMNHENSIFRFFGVDRVSGGMVSKWAPMAQDCVGMVVHLVDVSSVESFNYSLQELADCLNQIRPNLGVMAFAFGIATLKKSAESGEVDLKQAFPSYSGDKLEKFVKSRISRRSPSWFSGKFKVEFVDELTDYDYYSRAIRLGNQVLIAQIHEVIYELTEAI